MSSPESSVPLRVQRYGELLYRRATGEAKEMQCARSLCERLAPLYAPGMRVLDVGCGAGHYLRSLRARLDPAIDYTGIDLVAHYIGLARRAFPGEDRFSVADARELPFDDGGFDLVLCINVVPNLPPPPTRALAELVRVARRHIVLRTLFADTNYLIRELAPGDEPEHRMLGTDGEPRPGSAVWNNMYTEAFYRGAIGEISGDLAIEIARDEDWEPFDGRDEQAMWSTQTEGRQQIGGQLLLDWRFITLTKQR